MYRKLVLLYLILGSTTIFAQEELRISGSITGISNDAKVTLSATKEMELEVRDGKFEVSLPLEEPTSVYLYVEQGGTFHYTYFYLGNETVVIEGSLDDFPSNILAKNSKYDGLRYKHNQLTKALQEQGDELEMEAYTLIEEGGDKKELYEIYMGIPSGKITLVKNKLREIEYAFLLEHINTNYARSLLHFHANDFTTVQFQALLDAVDPQYKNTKEIQFIQALVNYPALTKGDHYYDFSAKDIGEKQVYFHSFFDGKYVLLDFSTWFCGYCQQAAPITAEMAEKLKNKLNYVTYYVDNNKEKLASYYELKGKRGTVVWNEQGEYDEVIAKYRQTGTPRYLLFNPKGQLMQSFEGLEEDFEEQITTLIQ